MSYSEAVLARFRSAPGAGRLPPDAERVGTGEAARDAGERIRIQVRLGPDGAIAESRFKAFGCPVAIACGSYAAERVVGAAPRQAAALSVDEIAAALELDVDQRAIAALAVAALAAALAGLGAAGEPERMGT